MLSFSYFKEMTKNTGAIIMGRHVYEMADPFMWINDDYEFQIPLFILTHTPPEKFPTGNDNLTLRSWMTMTTAFSCLRRLGVSRICSTIGDDHHNVRVSASLHTKRSRAMNSHTIRHRVVAAPDHVVQIPASPHETAPNPQAGAAL